LDAEAARKILSLSKIEVALRIVGRFKEEPMKVSVIIPVLNERDCMPENLAALERQNWIHEIIVVDGGSTDGTLAWLQNQSGVKVIESRAGRGIQLNAGARAATGDTLVFLHADTLLPSEAAESLRSALEPPQVCGGCFCARFDSHNPRSLGIVAFGINLRTVLIHSATGDQAIFARRTAFEKIGGFREWPLFEDVDFVSRMKRIGKFIVIRSCVTISARRHIHYGIFRIVMLCHMLRIGFWLGISPFELARWYKRSNAQSEHAGWLGRRVEPNAVSEDLKVHDHVLLR
jgi:rSAM/selenodomain-associated transferase 2